MGNGLNNNINNENNPANQIDQNQQLIQGNDQDISLIIDPPSIKNVYAVKNPIYLLKETLVIEKDSENQNIYYIKFNYDSLCYFNLFINFNVRKNPANNDKKLLPESEEKSLNKYAYIPSSSFEKNVIEFYNLPPGHNVEFFEKKACFDVSYLNTNKSRDNRIFSNNNMNNLNEIDNIIDNTNNNIDNNNNNNKNQNELIYDICIEMHSLSQNENTISSSNESLSNKNKVIFVSLCKITQEDNQLHNYVIHCELQRLKTFSMWIDLYDVFNCALESGECLICCSNIRNTIFLPCKHSCTCNNCAHSLRMRNNPCPICKNNIDDLLIIETEDDTVNNDNSNKNNIDNSNNRFIQNNDVENIDEEEIGNENINNNDRNFDNNNGMNNNIDNENNVKID